MKQLILGMTLLSTLTSMSYAQEIDCEVARKNLKDKIVSRFMWNELS